MHINLLTKTYLTKEESKTLRALYQKSGIIVSRDDIAQSVWDNLWLEKYSDWQIDRLIYLVRKKLKSEYVIKTVRNSGYILSKKGFIIPNLKPPQVEGAIPTESYLEYMNDPKNKRKVLKDLVTAMKKEELNKVIIKNLMQILVVNSYSYDNIDTLHNWLKQQKGKCEVFFINFDNRALKIHQERIEKLKINNFYTLHDDIRNSKLKDNFFDLVINDFRLNFNTSDRQNNEAVKNMHRILRNDSYAILSVVIDPRYESKKFGDNQEKAPTNKDKPWTFIAQEGLRRNCFTVPYYKRLFVQNGFGIMKEFDLENGKRWNPPYRRFLLQKTKNHN